MLLSFKYRLFTNVDQERELSIALETHRRLYNICLDFRQLAYEQYKASISYCDCSKWFTHQRKKNTHFAQLNRSSASATMRQLDKAFVNFFRRVKAGATKAGYPRFKGKDYFNSITFPDYGDGARLTDNRLRLQHIGIIRVKLHRPVEGKIKTLTVKREAGKWYVTVCCELPDIAIKTAALPPVGIDVGLTSFLTTSDGKHEPNPRYLKAALPALQTVGRAVSRKKRGGTNRRKAVSALQKLHARIKNLRREHHYQVAHRLILAYGTIAVESLNVQGMLKNHRLAQAISDAGWAGFLSILQHKAQKAGAQFVEVDPRGTSQNCSGCGQEVPKTLAVRWHECPHCGLSLDRDHNAALNILSRGLARIAPAECNVGHETTRSPRSQSLTAAV